MSKPKGKSVEPLAPVVLTVDVDGINRESTFTLPEGEFGFRIESIADITDRETSAQNAVSKDETYEWRDIAPRKQVTGHLLLKEGKELKTVFFLNFFGWKHWTPEMDKTHFKAGRYGYAVDRKSLMRAQDPENTGHAQRIVGRFYRSAGIKGDINPAIHDKEVVGKIISVTIEKVTKRDRFNQVVMENGSPATRTDIITWKIKAYSAPKVAVTDDMVGY